MRWIDASRDLFPHISYRKIPIRRELHIAEPSSNGRLNDERRIEVLIQTLQESLGTSDGSHKEPNAVQLQTAALS